ncbi:MAG: GerMN domain-containing protein [Spirochaetaceae bacterium]|jgi:hypothetical protein|nr:GerMN domain-containing protein [Spirochaetaceae bacterium]
MKKTSLGGQKRAAVIILGLWLLFALSSAAFLLFPRSVRRVFFFPAPGGGLYAETRSLANPEGDSGIGRYVDELLLGPAGSRCVPLFAPGTRAVSCFRRGRTLYLDLSGEALFAGNTVSPLKEGVAGLKKNILRNFRGLSEVNVYIDGRAAYEETP